LHPPPHGKPASRTVTLRLQIAHTRLIRIAAVIGILSAQKVHRQQFAAEITTF
jgi:hypothetical protein